MCALREPLEDIGKIGMYALLFTITIQDLFTIISYYYCHYYLYYYYNYYFKFYIVLL